MENYKTFIENACIFLTLDARTGCRKCKIGKKNVKKYPLLFKSVVPLFKNQVNMTGSNNQIRLLLFWFLLASNPVIHMCCVSFCKTMTHGSAAQTTKQLWLSLEPVVYREVAMDCDWAPKVPKVDISNCLCVLLFFLQHSDALLLHYT